MNLNFEYSKQVGVGTNPAVVHFPDNSIMLFWLEGGRLLRGSKIQPPTGDVDWGALDFGQGHIVTGDREVTFMRLKNVPRLGVYGVWHSNSPDERHRFAIYESETDLGDLVVEGTISFRLDDPVSKITIEFENPGHRISNSEATVLVPGSVLTLYFTSGDSEPYPMGIYYVDRNSMGETESATSVDGRNSIGKLLRDQTFDENTDFPAINLQQTFEAILDSFGVTNYWVGDTGFNVGMKFPPDMNGYEGILETLKSVANWKMMEGLDGFIGIGFNHDTRFHQPSNYSFYRDKDIFSREVTRDDMDIYSRVCVHDGVDKRVFRDVEYRFIMARKKTLYVTVPEGTTIADMTAYAEELAGLIGNVGVIETFVGPFRPHLIVGDTATIVGTTSKLLGVVTSVTHKFGKKGFSTEFEVDSGRMQNKTRISDYINKIKGVQTTGQAKRFY